MIRHTKKLFNFFDLNEKKEFCKLIFCSVITTLLELISIGLIIPIITILFDGNMENYIPESLINILFFGADEKKEIMTNVLIYFLLIIILKNPLYKIWQKMELKFPDLKKLRKYAKKLNIYFICSVFDIESLSMSRKLKIDALKIASSDITDAYLQNYLSKEKKPIILSTGMSEKSEIEKCIKNLKSKNLAILHCVSLYPCDFKRANLNRILSLKKNFKYTIGYSDHCIGPIASILSINLGAKIIEKHFTLNKNKIGLDHKLSADPMDLKIICDFAKNYKVFFGQKRINPSNFEKSFRKLFRKGIYFRRNIKKGEKILEKDIIVRRPMNKNNPADYKKIINKISKKNFLEGDEIKKGFLS